MFVHITKQKPKNPLDYFNGKVRNVVDALPLLSAGAFQIYFRRCEHGTKTTQSQNHI